MDELYITNITSLPKVNWEQGRVAKGSPSGPWTVPHCGSRGGRWGRSPPPSRRMRANHPPQLPSSHIAQASPLKHVHIGLRRPVDIGTAALSRRHTAQNSAFRILPKKIGRIISNADLLHILIHFHFSLHCKFCNFCVCIVDQEQQFYFL